MNNNITATTALESLINEEDRPFVMTKIWCHGQSAFPPIIGITSMAYAKQQSSSPTATLLWIGFFVLLVLCAWPFVSWRAITGANATTTVTIPAGSLLPYPRGIARSRRQTRYILLWWGGALVIGVYVSILAIIAFGSDRDGDGDGDSGSPSLRGLGLILVVFSALAAIETVAFLAVVSCLRNSLFCI